ncbi:family 43 glycosylhydrolase [Microbacterium dextranolyticum]|uniref:CBM6 domain-containing protein n=1 Tax=Microbacterium dextranolyticum TaxID=36806 RepID=A0A9W6HPT5_9MICO|nr:family 43 glycosylhydrolase [Microbacterium dextranolyticum]MBM7462390.1 hypothetical protein [Microbacterium dextranolyticum]GLJ96777.1 hypothetical protein GCM10017591_28400 [Microbacterium dextranolyticum]
MTTTSPPPSPLRSRRRAGIAALSIGALIWSALAGAASPAQAAGTVPTDGLIAQYAFSQTSGSTVPNTATGSGRVGDATVRNGTDALWNGDSLTFIGGAKSSTTANWVELPASILSGKNSATITTEVAIDASMKSAFNFLWNIGNNSNGSYYFTSVRDSPRTAITTSSAGGEANARSSQALDANRWYSLTSVIDGDADTISFYVDGVLVSTGRTTLSPASITDQSLNAIGRSPWPDPFFQGKVSTFRVYDRALQASEVKAVSDTDAALHASSFQSSVQTILNSVNPLTIEVEKPRLPDYNGAVTWSSTDPNLVVGSDGRLATAAVPRAGEPDKTGTVTATVQVRGVSATKTVSFRLKAPAASSDTWGNPIVQTIYTADPAPLVVGDTMYVYTGHDEDNSNTYVMNDWHVYSSTDMVNWTDRGSPLSVSTFAWARSDAWASQTIERNGKFYWYVTVTEAATGQRAIGVAVGDTPVGPFRDAIGKPLISRSEIDPTVFIDDDGQAYLYQGNPNLWWVKLNEDMISLGSTPEQIPLTHEGFGTKASDPTKTAYQEGPWVYKRNGMYYNVFAASCCSEYIAYSTSPTPTGPWTFRGTIMPSQGRSFTNHPGIVDFKGKSYFFYHNGALPGGSGYGRSVSIEEFTYNADGTIPTINMTTAGVSQIAPFDPYTRQEAETISWESGVEVSPTTGGGLHVSSIDNGDYIRVRGADFGSGASSFTARVGTTGVGGTIEVRLGSRTGTLVGTCTVPAGTAGSTQWVDIDCPVAGATGKTDVFFVFRGGSGELFTFDSWQFAAPPALTVSATAETRCVAGKVVLVPQVGNGESVAIAADVTSSFGTKKFESVAAGKTVSAAFSTRRGSIDAGTVTVQASVTKDGKTLTRSVDAAYAAKSCG